MAHKNSYHLCLPVVFQNKWRMETEKSLSCRRQTRATRYVTSIVLYTKVNAQCAKLATDDSHQFITQSVDLKQWPHYAVNRTIYRPLKTAGVE